MNEKPLIKSSQQRYLLRRLEGIFAEKRQSLYEKMESEKEPKELVEAAKELEKAEQKHSKLFTAHDDAKQKRKDQLLRSYQRAKDKTIFMSPEEALKAIDDFENLELP